MKTEPTKEFGARIKTCRTKAGLSLTKIADAASVSKSYIYELENGQSKSPSVYVALRLAAALGVSVEHLAYGDDTEAVPNSHLEVVELRRRLLRIERIAAGKEWPENS